jgi:hypothetical protein
MEEILASYARCRVIAHRTPGPTSNYIAIISNIKRYYLSGDGMKILNARITTRSSAAIGAHQQN